MSKRFRCYCFTLECKGKDFQRRTILKHIALDQEKLDALVAEGNPVPRSLESAVIWAKDCLDYPLQEYSPQSSADSSSDNTKSPLSRRSLGPKRSRQDLGISMEDVELNERGAKKSPTKQKPYKKEAPYQPIQFSRPRLPRMNTSGHSAPYPFDRVSGQLGSLPDFNSTHPSTNVTLPHPSPSPIHPSPFPLAFSSVYSPTSPNASLLPFELPMFSFSTGLTPIQTQLPSGFSYSSTSHPPPSTAQSNLGPQTSPPSGIYSTPSISSRSNPSTGASVLETPVTITTSDTSTGTYSSRSPQIPSQPSFQSSTGPYSPSHPAYYVYPNTHPAAVPASLIAQLTHYQLLMNPYYSQLFAQCMQMHEFYARAQGQTQLTPTAADYRDRAPLTRRGGRKEEAGTWGQSEPEPEPEDGFDHDVSAEERGTHLDVWRTDVETSTSVNTEDPKQQQQQGTPYRSSLLPSTARPTHSRHSSAVSAHSVHSFHEDSSVFS
ncbi:hypothetical protein [Phaffia rhodozyma]|uniref:Uncharacterized protein n=1 Tax=Phaffia rhodozyma TaxID=264483 RepID=A0A0F7SQX6_PHARH|nr:hypothetical protein [Phaffia rhodozyma]